MATAGEAATLFGSTDSASDPFALASGDDESDTRNYSTGDNLFTSQDHPAATDIFGSSVDHAAYFSSDVQSDGSAVYGQNDGAWSTGSTQGAAGYGISVAPAASEGYGGYSNQSVGKEWGTQQWSSYGTQSYNPQANGTYGAYSQVQPAQSYNQYSLYNPPAPPAAERSIRASSQGSYAANVYGPSIATAAPSQSVYDPYKPSQVASPAPAVVSQNQSTYSHAPEPAAIPIPEVPSIEPKRSTTPAAAYRPKTLDAYDPPLPPPKPAPRRGSAWQHTPIQYGFQGAPATPYGTSPANTMVPPSRGATASLPPPPRVSTASLPPPPRVSSAARQYTSPPSAPYYQHSMQKTADPYASPPRPPPSHLNQAFSPPPIQAVPREAYAPHHRAQHYGEVAKDPYASSSQWSGETRTAQYDGLPPSSHGTPAADDIQSMYGTVDAHPVRDSLPIDDAEAGGIPWEETNEPQSAVRQSPPVQEVGPEVEQTVINNAESVWDAVVTNAPTHAEVRAQDGIVASTPTSPNAQIVQRIASPASSKRSSTSSIALHDPYKPNGVSGLAAAQVRALSPERARSPGSSSVKSSSSLRRTSLEQSRSIASPPPPRNAQRPPSAASQSGLATYAYEPPPALLQAGITQRTASPSSFSVRSVHSTHSVRSIGSIPRRDSSAYDPYAPLAADAGSSTLRERSTSNGSTYSTVVHDPYAPLKHPRQLTQEATSYNSFSAMPPAVDHTPPALAIAAAAQIALVPPTVAPYAPSPSLLGTNDPLGRTSVRIPVVSFGFGGKLVTCFHGSSVLNTGFDVAMSSRASTDIHIRPLHKVIPQSALDTSAASYPGPLFSDPGTPTTTLVRTGAAAQTKTKKTRVIKYLEERVEEISRGLGYLHQGSMEGYHAEAKRVLINLLKVMVENDGKLSGSAQIDTAVRAALVPGLDLSADTSVESFKTPALGFTHASDVASQSADANDSTIVSHTLRASHLEKIQQLLLRGDRRGAYQYAADEKLWAHAMILASSIDKEAWKEVVTEFVRTELAGQEGALVSSAGSLGEGQVVATGREPLKVAYSLFAGHGSAAVQELLPPKPLTSMTQLNPLAPVASTVTPMTASFPPPFQTSPVPTEILKKWTETAAMMISSPMTAETSSALTALGDQLLANNWVEAAHACYLLSPQTSPIGGAGAPSVRVVLYGAPSPHVKPNFWKDPDPVIFTEIVEFALSLAAPTKGQEAFVGIPHLQPYRLVRASSLAELGHVQLANRYCEAISASLTRPSAYLNVTFVEQLRSLADRLVAAPLVDKSGSWIGSKMARPSLDKIGNWLEGRFTSFIAGDDESPKHEMTHAKEPSFSGPFAHYSTISSTTTSTAPSPQLSTTNLNGMHSASLPTRTGSAMALGSATGSSMQIARASSAIDYLRRKPSPVPRVPSASAASATLSNVPPAWGGQAHIGNGYAPIPEATPKAERSGKLDVSVEEEENVPDTSAGPQLGSWWGSSDSGAPTPTASSFDHSDASASQSTDGFISLMDAPTFGAPQSFSRTPSSQRYEEDEEDDELGLGNSTLKKNMEKPEAEDTQEVASTKNEPDKLESEKEAEKPASSGGWLSRLWKRSDSNPGPVKANLGDASSFYYDKELKRWVNKNVRCRS
ncbi:hypothetical protein NM688_g4435 [Phlebia brevispora]|uniref:Uncharacterized protein n=1 Tax=Phlebia brevispora TaxID=194682 RepID=A0ACC1T2Z3_9APHY|nr:hypothetical protein NM688_g4435 [Phlebia brevispora]